MIASTALSIGEPSPVVADNTTAVVVHRSDSNLPATTPDISRPAGVSSSALLPLIEETDILVEETHAVKRRRLSTTGETIYNIQVTVAPQHLAVFNCRKLRATLQLLLFARSSESHTLDWKDVEILHNPATNTHRYAISYDRYKQREKKNRTDNESLISGEVECSAIGNDIKFFAAEVRTGIYLL